MSKMYSIKDESILSCLCDMLVKTFMFLLVVANFLVGLGGGSWQTVLFSLATSCLCFMMYWESFFGKSFETIKYNVVITDLFKSLLWLTVWLFYLIAAPFQWVSVIVVVFLIVVSVSLYLVEKRFNK